MTDISKVNIYKIYSDDDDELIYVGSTRKLLKKRLLEHRNTYTAYKNEKYQYVTSFDLFDKYGFENCKIELLEQCDENLRSEREGYYIKMFDCVNKVIPDRTRKEYTDDYYHNNRDKLKQQSNKYYQVNKQKINEDRREIINCVCGRKCAKSAMSRHKKSIIHKTYVTNNYITNNTNNIKESDVTINQ
jgi:hypothetical protein